MENQLDELMHYVCDTVLLSASQLQSCAAVELTGDVIVSNVDSFGEALLREVAGLPVPQVHTMYMYISPCIMCIKLLITSHVLYTALITITLT